MILKSVSRRQFVHKGAAALALASLPPAALARRGWSSTAPVASARRLTEGWAFRRGPLTLAQARAGQGTWQPVTLPHCTNADDACDPDHAYFQGESWYRLTLPINNPHAGGYTLLHFRGAGQTTTVWAAGKLLGSHVGGYDEFVIDLTQAAQGRGELELLICCDNIPDPSRSPSNLSDFCLYGGLYRHVELTYLPALALDHLRIGQKFDSDGSCTLEIHGQLYGGARSDNTAATVPLQVELRDPSGGVLFSKRFRPDRWTGSQLLATIVVAKPERWSPDAPRLYRCQVQVGSGAAASVVEERIGLRETAFPEHGLFSLNGKTLFLRGTQRHQDCAESAGAQTDASVRQEMTMLKAMGANFIRLGHYQQDRLVLDLCDELGILVWEEVPWCRSGIGGEAWQTNTRRQLHRMIEQHGNHPSIVFWGLGNEDDWPEEKPSVNVSAIRAYMTELQELAHRLDPSRLTSYRRCDFARDIPDIYSPSVWAGWYNGTYRELEKSLASQRGKQKRLLHIEWGADSHAGRHSEDPYQFLNQVATGTGSEERDGDYLRSGGATRVSRDGDWSETYACDLFDWYLKTQETMPWLAGSAQWVFKDFASPLRADSPIPRVNQKGVLERDLTPKESYAVFQSYWSTQPMIHIYGHTWPRRWGAPGQRRTVKVYSNCSHVELFLNGKSLGIRKRDAQDFPAANLRWEVAFAPGANTLRATGHHAGGQVEDAIGLDYETRAWSAPAQLRLSHVAGQQGHAAVQAEVLDAQGLRCLDSRLVLRFESAGTVVLACNQGTVTGSRVLEAANGLVRLRIVQPGSGLVRVSAPGLSTATLQISPLARRGTL